MKILFSSMKIPATWTKNSIDKNHKKVIKQYIRLNNDIIGNNRNRIEHIAIYITIIKHSILFYLQNYLLLIYLVQSCQKIWHNFSPVLRNTKEKEIKQEKSDSCIILYYINGNKKNGSGRSQLLSNSNPAEIFLARFYRRNVYRVVETELRRNARLLMFKLVESDPLGFIDRSAFEKSKIIDSYLDENEWLSRIPGLLPDSLSALTSTSKFSRISSMLSKVGRLEGFGSQHLVSRSFSIFEEKFFKHGREFVSTTFVRRASKQMPFPKGFFSAHISQRRIPNE